MTAKKAVMLIIATVGTAQAGFGSPDRIKDTRVAPILAIGVPEDRIKDTRVPSDTIATRNLPGRIKDT